MNAFIDLIQNQYTDDAYLKSIEQYRDNTEFYNYLLQNPYMRSKNADFSPNFWQGLASTLFDDDSAAANYYQNLLSQQNQWFTEAYNKFYEQDYNSAQKQVEREKAAGLNPDINGQITPGNAAENDQPISPVSMPQDSVMPSAISSLSTLGTLANTITSAAFSVISSIQSINGTHLENVLKRFGLNETLRGTALNIIRGGIGEYLEGDALEPGSIIDKPGYVRSVSKYFSDRLDRLPYTNKEKRMLRPILDSLIRTQGESGEDSFTANFEKLVNDSYSELFKSRNSVSHSSAQPGADKETITALRFVGSEIYKPLADLQNEVNKLVLESQKSYYQIFNSSSKDPVTGESLDSGPVAQAKAAKFGYRMQSQMNDVKNRVLKAFEEINKKITGSKKISEGWKLALQAGVSTAESLFMSSLANGFHLPSGLIQNTTKNYNSIHMSD